MAMYMFNGRIRPEWLSVQLAVTDPPLRFNIQDVEGGSCGLTLLLGQSQLSLVVTTATNIQDVVTFRNQIMTTARSLFDAISYLKGIVVDIELTSMVDVTNNTIRVFQEAVQELVESESDRPTPIGKVIELGVSNVYLRRALSDLRQAIIIPDDTAFFCWRAVETIMQTFKEKGQSDVVARAAFRSKLHVDQKLLDILGGEAASPRHGKPKPILGARRVYLMERTWRIMDRYIEYLLLGKKELPIAEFQLLTK